MTTRLIVKSLPANCTEASLRSFFKKYGTLSDCTLKYTKEGKFRKFAFVGFDSEENAKKALKETDLSFMGSSRLHVEECKPFGDANKPRAWSQYSKDSRLEYERRFWKLDDCLYGICLSRQKKRIYISSSKRLEKSLNCRSSLTKRLANVKGLLSNGKIFKGKMLNILPGSENRERNDTDKIAASEKTSYKKEKMAKLKAAATKSHSWNALFLGPNAIADTLAEKLGVKKGDLLNSESGESAGVRLALAETRLVHETR
ncbi:unnamed protein product, partial [Cylicocyclus nassatus]